MLLSSSAAAYRRFGAVDYGWYQDRTTAMVVEFWQPDSQPDRTDLFAAAFDKHLPPKKESPMTDANWQDKLRAQQRHEHLAATVRIAIGELCQLAEDSDALATAEGIYGITEMLEEQLKEGEVVYAYPSSAASA